MELRNTRKGSKLGLFNYCFPFFTYFATFVVNIRVLHMLEYGLPEPNREEQTEGEM